jgi:hypothetical protein
MDYKTLLKRLTGRRKTAKAAVHNVPRSAKTYRNFLNKPRTLIKKIPHWTGTICDPVGFFQHTGQCWLNSMAMMFLNADGLKEFTQPKAIDATLTVSETEYDIYESIFAVLKKEFPKNMIWKKVSYRNFKYHMDDFFIHLQNRFRRHYAFATGGVEDRVGGQNSLMCEYRAKSALLEGWEGPDKGGSLTHIFLLFFVMKSVFQLPVKSTYFFENKLSLTHIFGKDDIARPTGILLLTIDHSTCFFTCNDISYYYNAASDLQLFQFPYYDFLTHYTNGYSLYLSSIGFTEEYEDTYVSYPVLMHKTGHVIMYDPTTRRIITDGIVNKTQSFIYIEYLHKGKMRKVAIIGKPTEVHSMLKVTA